MSIYDELVRQSSEQKRVSSSIMADFFAKKRQDERLARERQERLEDRAANVKNERERVDYSQEAAFKGRVREAKFLEGQALDAQLANEQITIPKDATSEEKRGLLAKSENDKAFGTAKSNIERAKRLGDSIQQDYQDIEKIDSGKMQKAASLLLANASIKGVLSTSQMDGLEKFVKDPNSAGAMSPTQIAQKISKDFIFFGKDKQAAKAEDFIRPYLNAIYNETKGDVFIQQKLARISSKHDELKGALEVVNTAYKNPRLSSRLPELEDLQKSFEPAKEVPADPNKVFKPTVPAVTPPTAASAFADPSVSLGRQAFSSGIEDIQKMRMQKDRLLQENERLNNPEQNDGFNWSRIWDTGGGLAELERVKNLPKREFDWSSIFDTGGGQPNRPSQSRSLAIAAQGRGIESSIASKAAYLRNLGVTPGDVAIIKEYSASKGITPEQEKEFTNKFNQGDPSALQHFGDLVQMAKRIGKQRALAGVTQSSVDSQSPQPPAYTETFQPMGVEADPYF